MTLTFIFFLILFGVFLLILEILFVPGMILGCISILLMLTGIIFSFKDYGTTIGIITLITTGIATAVAVYWAFNSSLWKKLQVHTLIDGKANIVKESAIHVGDTGKTISRLNPSGKAWINNLQVEVEVMEDFIEEEKDIMVIKVLQNKIFVKLKT